MKLTYSNIGKCLFDFAGNYSEELSGIQVKKRMLWSVVKNNIFYYLLNLDSNNSGVRINKVSFFQKVAKTVGFLMLIPQLCFIYLKSFFAREKIIIYSLSADKLNTNSKNLYFNALMDPLILEKIIPDHYYIETSMYGDFKQPSAVKFDINGDWLRFPVVFMKACIQITNIHHGKCKKMAALFNDFLKSENIEAVVDQRVIADFTYEFIAEYIVYKFLWRALNSKVVIMSDQVGSGKMAAALDLHMKVIEVQHGLTDEYYPSYTVAPAFVNHRDKLIIPNRIATFGSFHVDIICKHGFWNQHEVLPVGSYRIESYRHKIRTSQEHKKSRQIILYPTQWHVFFHSKNLIDQLLKHYLGKLSDNLMFYIKPHPFEPADNIEFYKSLEKQFPGLVKCFDSANDIYKLLEEVDLVFGYDSTFLLESVALGIPTITMATIELPGGVHDFVQNNSLLEAIKIAKTEKDIVEYIDKLRVDSEFRQKWLAVCKAKGNYLFSETYKENWHSLIRHLDS